MRYFVLTALLLVSVTACKTYTEDDRQEFSEKVLKIAQQHDWQVEQSESGLAIQILEEGTGTEPIQRGSQVVLSYTGKLSNGHVFDKTHAGKPLSAPLTGLIGGFQEGLVGLKQGTHLRMIVPPNMGYGDEQTGEIPPNSILIFDIVIDTLY